MDFILNFNRLQKKLLVNAIEIMNPQCFINLKLVKESFVLILIL